MRSHSDLQEQPRSKQRLSELGKNLESNEELRLVVLLLQIDWPSRLGSWTREMINRATERGSRKSKQRRSQLRT